MQADSWPAGQKVAIFLFSFLFLKIFFCRQTLGLLGSSPGLHLEMQSDQPGSEVSIMMMFFVGDVGDDGDGDEVLIMVMFLVVLVIMVMVMIWAMKMMKMVVPLGI